MTDKPIASIESLPPDVKERMLKLRDNFLICCVKRAGGKIQFPIEEVDRADDLLTMSLEDDPTQPQGKIFTIQVTRRQ